MKDKIKFQSTLKIMVLLLVCVSGLFIYGKGIDAKTKTITIIKGETYQLKVKKGSKIVCNNKKIAKVTKKGKIKALKMGKCTVTVKKGKKIKKYKIHVTMRAGGAIMVNHLFVDHIEVKDGATSIVYLTTTEQTPYFDKEKIKIVKFECSNEYLTDISSGDEVSIGINLNSMTQKIENGTDTITGNVYIKLDNHKPAPTNVPPGGVLLFKDLKVEKMEQKDDQLSTVTLVCENPVTGLISDKDFQNGVRYVRFDVSSGSLSEKGIASGDNVSICFNIGYTQMNIVDNAVVLSGDVSINKNL